MFKLIHIRKLFIVAVFSIWHSTVRYGLESCNKSNRCTASSHSIFTSLIDNEWTHKVSEFTETSSTGYAITEHISWAWERLAGTCINKINLCDSYVLDLYCVLPLLNVNLFLSIKIIWFDLDNICDVFEKVDFYPLFCLGKGTSEVKRLWLEYDYDVLTNCNLMH